MNQNNRICTQWGHEQYKVDQICTYRWCNMTRWCCSQCLNNDIHRHSMPNSNHIMNQTKLSNKVKQDLQNLKNEYLDSNQGTQIKTFLQQQVKEFQKLEMQIMELRQKLIRQLNNPISDEDNFKLQLLIQKVEAQSFISLNDEDINKLLNINQYQFNYDIKLQFQDSLDKIQQQLNILQQNVKESQEKNKTKIIDFISRQYYLQKIYKGHQKFCINESIISKNEQYLVYNLFMVIHIYHIKINKVYKSKVQKNELSSLQFTIDSKHLFAGDYEGFVYGYYVQNGFKTFYKQKIHQGEIIQILIQKQYLITASKDAKIIKTNFIKKNQIFQLFEYSNSITSIDYDIKKDIIISCNQDNRSIKIWDCLNQSILIDYVFEENYTAGQIQLINNKQDILCQNGQHVCKFSIDYQNMKLVQTNMHEGFGLIQGYQQVNNDQNLLVLTPESCYILNNEGEVIHYTSHVLMLVIDRAIKSYRHQLDYLNYIILQDGYEIHLLRAKDYK